MSLTIACDVDDCITLNHINVWLEAYRLKYGIVLPVEYITDWNITKFIPPEIGGKIYGLRQPGMYSQDFIKPLPEAQTALAYLKQSGHKLVAATKEKNEAIALAKVFHEIYVGNDKNAIPADVLIEDCAEVLDLWPRAGILFTKPWNLWYNTSSRKHIRADNWQTIIRAINFLADK